MRPVLLWAAVAMLAAPAVCGARHRARLDPTEPIFTRRAFIEKNAELDVGVTDGVDDDTVSLTTGLSWVVLRRLELELAIPWTIRVAEDGGTVGALDDVGFALQLLVCCGPDGPLDYLSLAAGIDAPTGDRSRDIGGEGAWSISLLPARRVTVLDRIPDVLIAAEVTFAQAIRHAAGEEGGRLQKELDWNLVFAQQYLRGHLRPVLEMLGTSTVEAARADDVGTSVALAVGLWTVPFADEHALAPLSVGLGVQLPVTGRRDDDGQALLIFDWGFD